MSAFGTWFALRSDESEPIDRRIVSGLARRHPGGRSDGETDGTKTNLGVERLLEVTENPRNQFLFQAYYPPVDVTPG